ncbi:MULTISPECIES: LysR family transcriptional regulator [Pasteurellaceae]|uniref:LysR family transcriptional regulator n=1 Tax=Pasteurella atlantica TaxID=2827233 RepID=A0AAW8CNH9_9PAST|nr:LysR family transcriptional regulator [Pasteurella atlantica]MBR0573243.1 LysR family transcriptional regulator [Pasteurella atlantica]MDP8039141.1 LysR family transcriptional regulator [Pasteurella atlantica]MDP8041260.1 LysR family transcriptional regulator [Pasteurella atlantica]MDP8043397.1 LysR family transcriptional regulator [Pasteurella atlantica]MDP8045483.1 LysR family transcriptional regulator [Pasteurella atlantica]
MLNNLSLFVTIVKSGSFQKAATQMNIPTSTLTRRLQRLEASLDCKLLHRSSRGIKLTQEGETYFEKCQPILAMLEQNIQDIHQHTTQASGTVRVLAPINLSLFMANFWYDFLIKYPDIDLILQLNNCNDNLLEQGADLALRTGKQNNANLIQKRLATTPTCIVATKEYLQNNTPIHHPLDLQHHHWLVAQPLSNIVLTNEKTDERVHLTIPKARLQVNEVSLCIDLVKQNLGLSYVPEILCQTELKKGELIKLLPTWQIPERTIYVLWNEQKQLPKRVKVLVEELVAFFESYRGE